MRAMMLALLLLVPVAPVGCGEDDGEAGPDQVCWLCVHYRTGGQEFSRCLESQEYVPHVTERASPGARVANQGGDYYILETGCADLAAGEQQLAFELSDGVRVPPPQPMPHETCRLCVHAPSGLTFPPKVCREEVGGEFPTACEHLGAGMRPVGHAGDYYFAETMCGTLPAGNQRSAEVVTDSTCATCFVCMTGIGPQGFDVCVTAPHEVKTVEGPRGSQFDGPGECWVWKAACADMDEGEREVASRTGL